MNEWRPVFTKARTSLVILGSAAFVSLVLVLGGLYGKDRLQKELAERHSQVAALQTSLETKQQDLDYVRANAEKFHQLKSQGLVGIPEREGWVEQLVVSRKQLNLPDTLSYTLKAPRPLAAGGAAEAAEAAGTGGAPVEIPPDAAMVHDLEIEVTAYHEDEVLGLLGDVRGKARGSSRIQACRFSEPRPEGLTANCTLRFFNQPEPVVAKSGEHG